MSSSRNQILADIRRQLPVDAPLPSHEGPWIRYDDPQRQFLDVLAAVGGKGEIVAGAEALRTAVAEIAASIDPSPSPERGGVRGGVIAPLKIFSAVPAAAPGTVPWESIDDPYDLADVDLAIAPGELAVAENAAVWVTDAVLPQRSAYFLAQHLMLIVPAAAIVHNMHEAYAWLAAQSPSGKPFAEPMFGTFLSGPSKTADIEQALVIGAHGARSLHVLLFQECA